LELGFFWMELKTRDTIVQHVILDDLNEQADMIWKLVLVELGSTLASVQYVLKKVLEIWLMWEIDTGFFLDRFGNW